MKTLSLQFAQVPEDLNAITNAALEGNGGFRIEQVNERRGNVEADEERDKAIRIRIQKVVEIIFQTHKTDINWKNLPIIWELLSVRQEEISGASTPLPQLIGESVAEMPRINDILSAVDMAQLVEDLDEVIHQVYFRRRVILEAVNKTMEGDLSSKTPMDISEMVRHLAELLKGQQLTEDALESAIDACCEHCEEPHQGDDKVKEIVVRPYNPGLKIAEKDVTRVTLEESLNSQRGDVYYVRSPQVGEMGDHIILMVGGFVRRPHGMRPNSIAFGPLPKDEITPLNAYDDRDEGLVLLRLNDIARQAFYNHHGIEGKLRKRITLTTE